MGACEQRRPPCRYLSARAAGGGGACGATSCSVLRLAFVSRLSLFAFVRAGVSDLLPQALWVLWPLPGSPEQTGNPGCCPGSQHLTSPFMSSIKQPHKAPPALCVQDVNPSSAWAVSFALAHRAQKGLAAGLSLGALGCQPAPWWGAGISTGSCTGDRIWHPQPPLPWLDERRGRQSSVGSGPRRGKDALPQMGTQERGEG